MLLTHHTLLHKLMAISFVERALTEFAQADEPQILALTGEWGLGKTFYWRKFLASQSAESHRVQRYAYVSLFGLKNLDDIQDAVVSAAVPIEDVSLRPKVSIKSGSLADRAKTGLQQTMTAFERTTRSYSYLIDNLPKIGQLGPLARSIAFRLVEDYLVCIDDVERRSEALSLKDVMGMASLLREQRRCRVLIIMNSNALSDEDRDTYESLREKVFDAEIAFEPSVAESVAIAFPKHCRLYERAAEFATKLKIRNIRVLYRIRRVIDLVADVAMIEDDEVQTQVIQSSVLLGWCFNTRDGTAPSFSYVKGLNYLSFIDLDKSKQRPASEVKWNEILSGYGYLNTDELDAAISEVLERGYVESERLNAVLSNRAEAVHRARLEYAFSAAWDLYHQSFDPSPKKLVAAFEYSVKAGSEVISSLNMSGTATLLRSLGYDALAGELVAHWIDVQLKVRPAVLNVQAAAWQDDIRDVHFRTEAQAAFDRLPQARKSFRDTLIEVTEQNAWNDRDLRVLSSASVDEYYELFKSQTFPSPAESIRVLLRFDQGDGSEPNYRTIVESTREALMRIGRESVLNRRRVKAFGVDLDSIENVKVSDDAPPTAFDEQTHSAG